MARLLTNRSPAYQQTDTQNNSHTLQFVNYFFTKNYRLTRTINIFLASLLLVNYVKDMENPKPNINFTPSNCVVHDDTHGWGGL